MIEELDFFFVIPGDISYLHLFYFIHFNWYTTPALQDTSEHIMIIYIIWIYVYMITKGTFFYSKHDFHEFPAAFLCQGIIGVKNKGINQHKVSFSLSLHFVWHFSPPSAVWLTCQFNQDQFEVLTGFSISKDSNINDSSTVVDIPVLGPPWVKHNVLWLWACWGQRDQGDWLQSEEIKSFTRLSASLCVHSTGTSAGTNADYFSLYPQRVSSLLPLQTQVKMH